MNYTVCKHLAERAIALYSVHCQRNPSFFYRSDEVLKVTGVMMQILLINCFFMIENRIYHRPSSLKSQKQKFQQIKLEKIFCLVEQ